MSNREASKLAKRRWAGMSPEERSAAAAHAARAQWAKIPPEARSAIMRARRAKGLHRSLPPKVGG